MKRTIRNMERNGDDDYEGAYNSFDMAAVDSTIRTYSLGNQETHISEVQPPLSGDRIRTDVRKGAAFS